MERYYSQIIGLMILTSNGETVSLIREIVIDPNTGKVEGFLVGLKGDKVLLSNDILSFTSSVQIHDEDEIINSHEVIKIKKILEQNTPILKNKVEAENGLYLGKVVDFTINTKMFVLTKIVVAKLLFGIFPYSEKIIVHNDILEIKKDKIIVKNPIGTIKVQAKEPLVSIDPAPST